MNDRLIAVYDTVWHQILFHLQVDRLAVWSRKLEKIPPLDLDILSLVHENPNLLIGEAGKRLSIPMTTLSSAVSRMEKKGLIQRAIAPHDLRSFSLVIMPKGRELLREFDDVHAMLSSRVLNCMDSREEKEDLIEIFEKTAAALDPQVLLHTLPDMSLAERFNKAWQKTLFSIRIDRLESWSDLFKGLSQLDLHVLNLVQGKPGMTLKEIRRTLQIPPSTVTVLVNKLVQRGCLEQEVIPEDLRLKGVRVTETGKQVLEEQTRLNQNLWKSVFLSFDSETKQQELLLLLGKILKRLM